MNYCIGVPGQCRAVSGLRVCITKVCALENDSEAHSCMVHKLPFCSEKKSWFHNHSVIEQSHNSSNLRTRSLHWIWLKLYIWFSPSEKVTTERNSWKFTHIVQRVAASDTQVGYESNLILLLCKYTGTSLMVQQNGSQAVTVVQLNCACNRADWNPQITPNKTA